MSKLLFRGTGVIGLISATVFACGHVQTASQERAAIDQSAQQTAQSGKATAEASGSAASNFGRGVVHGAESVGSAAQLGAHEVGQTLTGQQGNPESEARSEDYRSRMQQQWNQAGSLMQSAGQSTGETAREPGSTVYGAGETGVETGAYGVGSVRRAAGEKPEVAPSADCTNSGDVL